MVTAVDSNVGDTIIFQLLTPSVNGAVTVQLDGSIDYTPNPNFCGTDTFDFIAYDNWGHGSDPATGHITVLCTNDTPIAIDDTLSATG
jgi:hypothetical protein